MWIALSLFYAVLIALSTFIIKHLLYDTKPLPLLIIVHLFAIPFFILLVIYFGIPQFTLNFLIYIVIVSSFSAIAALSSYKALSISQISLITPLASFVPLFTLLWAFLILGETPTPIKFLGIIIIVIGAYFLDIEDVRYGLFKPITDLFSSHGVRLYMIAVLTWSIAPIFEKQAIFETTPTTPIFVGFVTLVLSTVIILPFAIKDKITLTPIKKHWGWLTVLGIFFALFAFAGLTAITMTNIAYFSAISRLGTLFVVMLGAIILRESKLKERLLGGTIMIIGAILVAL